MRIILKIFFELHNTLSQLIKQCYTQQFQPCYYFQQVHPFTCQSIQPNYSRLLGEMNRFVFLTLPQLIKKICGDKIFRVFQIGIKQHFFTNHPIVQIFYVIFAVEGYLIYLFFGCLTLFGNNSLVSHADTVIGQIMAFFFRFLFQGLQIRLGIITKENNQVYINEFKEYNDNVVICKIINAVHVMSSNQQKVSIADHSVWSNERLKELEVLQTESREKLLKDAKTPEEIKELSDKLEKFQSCKNRTISAKYIGIWKGLKKEYNEPDELGQKIRINNRIQQQWINNICVLGIQNKQCLVFSLITNNKDYVANNTYIKIVYHSNLSSLCNCNSLQLGQRLIIKLTISMRRRRLALNMTWTYSRTFSKHSRPKYFTQLLGILSLLTLIFYLFSEQIKINKLNQFRCLYQQDSFKTNIQCFEKIIQKI
ncbi:unnamed protein product [Paramecium octaurelia]|uniref:Transmembrane protein n=1 Tax=Paramecium octaurelia TaxID=43137 RepID=A0A8S1YJ14_PAROT|nr:unnamed protein product [Paramecium octaurelia]